MSWSISVWSLICCWRCSSVSVGSANIHFFITVHILGAGFPGAALSMDSLRLESTPSSSFEADSAGAAGRQGILACHSANRLATAL